MLREAELFVIAEQMLVEVLGRVRPADEAIEIPPLADLPGAEAALPLKRVVELCARDDARVPGLLAAAAEQPAAAADQPAADVDPGSPGDHLAGETVPADAACAAARAVTDGDAVLHGPLGDLPARDYLLRLTVNRSLVAHYVAAYLGSTACPLPEELARPLWELTAPDAAAWRSLGVFRDPLPIPELASWRDTFLRTAGHEPHPLGH